VSHYCDPDISLEQRPALSPMCPAPTESGRMLSKYDRPVPVKDVARSYTGCLVSEWFSKLIVILTGTGGD
jgi:hypothetical protein